MTNWWKQSRFFRKVVLAAPKGMDEKALAKLKRQQEQKAKRSEALRKRDNELEQRIDGLARKNCCPPAKKTPTRGKQTKGTGNTGGVGGGSNHRKRNQ